MDKLACPTVVGLHPGGQIFLYDIHGNWRQEVAIRQYIQAIPIAANTGPLFDIRVPRGNILVPDRPVYRNTLSEIGLKVEVAMSVALAAPGERTAAYLIPAIPVESLYLDVRTFLLVDPKVEVLLV